MARNDSSQRSQGGCLGCFGVLALLIVLSVIAILYLAPPTLRNVLQAYGRTALNKVGLRDELPDNVKTADLGYAGRLLPEAQQDVYLQLLSGIRELKESFAITRATPTDIDPAFRSLIRDHPELFWVDGSCTYTYTSLGDVMNVEPGITVPLDQVESIRERIEAAAGEFSGMLPSDADEYTIARMAYEFVINTTDYARDADQNQNIQSVFLGHSSVCAGYARAYEYLLQQAGMECAYVEGSIVDTDEDHAWNLVRIGDVYTYVDPTWGDPTYAGDVDQSVLDSTQGIIYDYLCLTTEEIVRDRHAFADPEAWPPCTSTEYDWYVRAGSYYDAYDEEALSGTFWAQVNAGSRMVACKFGNDEAFSQAQEALTAGMFLRDELLTFAEQRGDTSLRYSYTTSDSLRIVKVYW